jgi:hypothetical protein
MNEEEKKQEKPEISEYKGNPVITLNPGSRFPFTFGVAKAKLILENLDEIRAFIAQYSK